MTSLSLFRQALYYSISEGFQATIRWRSRIVESAFVEARPRRLILSFRSGGKHRVIRRPSLPTDKAQSFCCKTSWFCVSYVVVCRRNSVSLFHFSVRKEGIIYCMRLTPADHGMLLAPWTSRPAHHLGSLGRTCPRCHP